MNSSKALIEKLETITNKKVILKEEEITRQIKKQFYGVTADLEREAKRVINFYERSVPLHPDLKSVLIRVKRSLQGMENAFMLTEAYLNSDKGQELIKNQPELAFPENSSTLTEEMTTADVAVPITTVKKKQ